MTRLSNKEELMRGLVSTCFIALGIVAGIAGQQPTAPARPDAPAAPTQAPSTIQRPDGAGLPQPSATSTSDPKSITVVGCITGGPAAFKLTQAVAATATAAKPETAVGTSGISTSYDLTPRAGVDLTSHVGHKVELTGTAMPASTATTPGGAAIAAAGAAGADKPAAARFNVTAVKMVSANCS
jgi:hypothetical protein